MNAGYLVARYIKNKLNSMGYNAVVTWLASKVGRTIAQKMVSKVVAVGVTAAATYIAGLLGASASVAGPLGFIIGGATGWL